MVIFNLETYLKQFLVDAVVVHSLGCRSNPGDQFYTNNHSAISVSGLLNLLDLGPIDKNVFCDVLREEFTAESASVDRGEEDLLL